MTELALGLLAPGEEREVERHLASCDSCAADAARLREGARLASHLELEEPSPRVTHAILQSARASLRHGSSESGRVAQVTNARRMAPAQSPWERVLEWFRQSATGPQGAMATLTLLLVAIGIFYLPSRRPLMNAEGDTVTEAPAPLAEPEAAPPMPALPAAAPAPSRPTTAPSRTVAPSTSIDARVRETELEGAVGDKPHASAMHAPAEGASEPAFADRDDLPSRALSREERPSRDEMAVNDAIAQPGHAAGPTGSGGADGLRRAAAPAPSRAVAGYAAAPPAPAPPTAPVAAPAAMESAASGARMGEANPTDSNATDLLAAARADRSRGACAAATNEYEQWLARSPASPQRGAAMIELADCLRRTGRITAARQWLERASETPAVAALARREIERLDESAPAASSAAPATAAQGRARAVAPASAAPAASSESSY